MDKSEAATIPGKEELLGLLSEAVDEVFRSLVFTFTEAAIRRDGSNQGEDIEVLEGQQPGKKAHMQASARVGFSGTIDGCVILRCYAEGAYDIARGLLMLDESEALEIDEVSDALGECANMITGVLKTKALDPVGDFSMSTPQVSTAVANEHGDTCGVLAYQLSQGLVSMEIWISQKEA